MLTDEDIDALFDGDPPADPPSLPSLPSLPSCPESTDVEESLADLLSLSEPFEKNKMPASSGYTSKVKVHDRYKVVGFISSGTYGRVYKAIGHNGQAGDFAIKKYVHPFSSNSAIHR